jgi:hypothetical protein
MDRKAVLDKIAAMLKLQESSTFEGETAAAAAMIDRLCIKYDVTISEAITPEVLTEDFFSTGRMNDADFILFCAVAGFYDAKGFVEYNYSSGRRVTTFKCIGTEAQQIQTNLYFQFLKDNMQKECDKAYKGEKILAELQGHTFNRTGFKVNFNRAFANKVKARLYELKLERGDHEHKQYTLAVTSKIKIGTRRPPAPSGLGGQLGYNAGENVSLNKQAGGSSQRLAIAGR